MDLAFSAEDDEFRDEARTWLAENTPSGAQAARGPGDRATSTWRGSASARRRLGRHQLADRVRRPRPADIQQMIWYEEFARTAIR